MFNVRISSPELQRLSRRMSRAPGLWAPALRIFLERTTAQLQRGWARKLGRKPFPHFTGAAAASIQRSHSVTARANRLRFGGKVVSPLVHVAVLEAGRRPGSFPAVDALTRWVQLRHQRGDISVDVPGLSPARRRTPAGLVERTAQERRNVAYRSLAFLIGREIKRRGIRGKRYARRTVRENRRRIDREARAMASGMARALRSRRGR